MNESSPNDIEVALGQCAEEYAERSYVPYSSRQRACVLLLEDGSLIPGARVENASFSLTLPAIANAFGTAATLGKTNIVAIGFSFQPSKADLAFLQAHPLGPFIEAGDRSFKRNLITNLPEPNQVLDPTQLKPSDWSTRMALEIAGTVSERAVIRESNFPVGALLELADGRLIPGVNVEHPDWKQIVCAETNAFGTAVTYGLLDIVNVFLNCPTDDQASPCGACRQVMVELAPQATVWMDRGNRDAEQADVDELLPGYFSGKALHRNN
ncbi:MAG: cytidine deaminase [Bacteroidetes bacterium]|nr:cytidine deaminase [Bacteroidota bacterium]